ncbi:sugar phosphate isomerase/epimerase family protein [Larkinella humicola]|uniref:Sugar phosphate isomerase/epimerase n=1 Tax=Larkinella humicola TaxID=2607654 RepID=A0A5N1J843_9BACT|nr:sugar phosphate isomerase/epimerase [Larkinella humicola]KAA9347851.1 sugar phosphate isomerase/epimerase [Larkinella humicola]
MMKTRLSLVLSTALLLHFSSGFAQKKVYTFPIGIQSYTYRNSFPKGVAATLDTIQSLGITEMEGGTPKGVTTEEFKKMLKDRNISIPGTGAGYELLVKDPMAVVQSAKELGSQFVMCAWIPHQKGNFTLENAKKAVEDFNRVGKVLKENGLTFCYHNHGFEFQPYEDGTLFDYMVKNTDPRYVSFEMDILWATHGGADPVKLLNKYGNRWKLMHLKDLKKGVKGDFTGNTPQENDVILGTGQIDMPMVLKTAKKVGIKHYFIEDESNIWSYQVPKSIAYLKNLTE